MNICVIYGGKSPEHEVSLNTAMTIINALDKQKYNVFPIYINEQGHWQCREQIISELTEPGELRGHPEEAGVVRSLAHALAQCFDREGQTVVFPALHGPNGEDGTLQGLLELLDLPYVGCGVLSSAIGMDKAMMKDLFAGAGIPQAKYKTVHRYQWAESEEAVCREIVAKIGFPCYVKPANMGSSIGISRCCASTELADALEIAFRYDCKVVVEQEVQGREVQLAMIGNASPVCSVAGEFVREPDFFDYDKKYRSAHLIRRIPADLSGRVDSKAGELALQIYRVLDGSGMMRIDFFVTADDEIYVNEVDTLPGFASTSMFPALWNKTDGTTSEQLAEKLIDLALERHALRSAKADWGQHV
ncbi:D-alanine--D-alanine ligase [Paenibacillaceae bacterium]|nr:D-alanine--D-alanine ligase [Paenibacillaceae bacterium]